MGATAPKIDYKRELGRLYRARREPAIVDVPEMSFAMIDGRGSPTDSADYMEAIGALYGVAYTLKFMVKRSPGGLDYTVMPLETLWWTLGDSPLISADPTDWRWTAMIMQPESVTGPMVREAATAVGAKRELPAPPRLRLERYFEGPSAQVLHVGPYEEEKATIERLMAFISAVGDVPAAKHHEIYLSDPNRTARDRLRTIIRQPIAPRGDARDLDGERRV